MNLIENIKAFLKEQGLNWTGKITTAKDKEFRPATAEDFKFLSNADYLIDFGKDGEIALTCQIDLITFKIYGETFDVCYSCYAGDNKENEKLIESLEDKDFSKEFIQFQLKSSGLLYAAAVRIKCQEQRTKVEEEAGRRVKQLTRKIGYLNSKIQKTEDEAFEEIKKINELEKLAEEFKIEQ